MITKKDGRWFVKTKKDGKKKQRFSRRKYEATIIYIISKTPMCGMKKLAFMLYQADFLHYAKTDFSITGETYRKRRGGVYGDHFEETVQRLESSGVIQYKSIRSFVLAGNIRG